MQVRNIPKLRLPALALAVALLTITLTSQFAAAATPAITTNGANGLRVSPVRTDITINPGETQVVSINVTNITSGPTSLQGIVNDFTANSNESGTPAIILDPNQYSPNHSLKRFVKPLPSFTLQAGEQKAIAVTIAVPANAAGGGYYGAVRFAPSGADGGANSTVSLAGSVGSLILVKVPGSIKDQLDLASFDVRRNNSVSSFFTQKSGITAVVRFQNNGNIQEEPFGKILLKNRSGKVLGQYEVNNVDPPGNVLPDSVRRFSIPLDKVSGFGEYKVEGNFGYGTNGQLLSASTTFYVVPAGVIIAFVLIVLLIVFLIFGMPRLVKAYNRRVIRQASRK